MTAPKPGDRVRVEFEGTVTDAKSSHSGRFPVAPVRSGLFAVALVHIAPEALTVLTPPAKVGDLLTAENVEDLPDGTVVVNAIPGGSAAQKCAEDWRTADNDLSGHSVARWSNPRIVYIPEVTE